jgi:hypothetical protein
LFSAIIVVEKTAAPKGAELSFVNRVQSNTSISQSIRFTDAEIVGEMNRSTIGREVANAANTNAISLEFEAFHPQAGVKGYCIPNTNRSVIFVENNTEFSAPGVIDRAATLREVGNTAVHEGLHTMGLGGSWEAELWVRRLTFEHSFGRAATAGEVAQMEAEMQAAGRVYTSLPRTVGRSITIGGRTISF